MTTDQTAEAGGEAAAAELVRATELERLRALVAVDMAVADQLHADDFQLINPRGTVLSKQEYLSRVASGAVNYQVWEFDSPVAVRLHNNVALIRYRSRLDNIVDGQALGLQRVWHTDTYEQRNGRWQAVCAQATVIQEPPPA
jgi:hypothetical protein